MLRELRYTIIRWLLSFERGNLIGHCERELRATGASDPERDFYRGMTAGAVMELVRLFSLQGHSGMSAGLVQSLFAKAASWEPLGPLTGEDEEWTEVSGGLYQNKRCPRVFKDENGAYDIEGKAFRDAPDGLWYTNSDSRVPVEFPYYPGTEYVEVAP